MVVCHARGLPELQDVVRDRIQKGAAFLMVRNSNIRISVRKVEENVDKLGNDVLEMLVIEFSRLAVLGPKLPFDLLGGRDGGS